MTVQDDTNLENVLEHLIDGRLGYMPCFVHLENICHYKAEHLQSNWQASETAKRWVTCAKSIDKTAHTVFLNLGY